MELRLTGFIVPHDLSPDAVIVIESPEELNAPEVDSMRWSVRQHFPDNKCMIMTGGVTMKIEQPAKMVDIAVLSPMVNGGLVGVDEHEPS
jgi:hypothetical protein